MGAQPSLSPLGITCHWPAVVILRRTALHSTTTSFTLHLRILSVQSTSQKNCGGMHILRWKWPRWYLIMNYNSGSSPHSYGWFNRGWLQKAGSSKLVLALRPIWRPPPSCWNGIFITLTIYLRRVQYFVISILIQYFFKTFL